jgi:hypothetical protein
MGRQHAHSARFRAIAETALAGLGIVALFGNLECEVAQLGDTVCSAAETGLRVLPSIALAAWQTIQATGLEHNRLSECFLEMLPSLWSLFHALAATL